MQVKMDPIEEMAFLCSEIRKYNDAYYNQDTSLISDRKYDALVDRLAKLEEETGIILSGSPTQHPGGQPIDALEKVRHTKPMLSAKKTKDVQDLIKFIRDGNAEGNRFPGQMTLGWKEDGLTIVLRYKDGVLAQAITRGDGETGEDVTHTVKMYTNVPLSIPTHEYVEVRGEGVVSWMNFHAYNESAGEGDQFAEPRNMAAGSTRVLDASVTKARNLSFLAFELVSPFVGTKTEEIKTLKSLGFETVETWPVREETLQKQIDSIDPAVYAYPVDGLILEYEDKEFGHSLGATGHHENCRIAYKWQDELYATHFRKVVRRTTRTGMVSLKAQFDPVIIEGSRVEFATLHNLSFFKSLQLGEGDEIQVYKANKIIPAIDGNLTRSGTYQIDMTCPCCGAPLEIHKGSDAGAETLHCPNDGCPAKKAAKFEHFASKPAMNIVGLSGAKLEDLLDYGYVKHYADLYHLDQYQEQVEQMEGWGARSFEKLQEAIEKSRSTKLANLIPALGIPMVGKHAGKDIHKYFGGDPQVFMDALDNGFDFHMLPDFGDVMCDNLKTFFADPVNRHEWDMLMQELHFETEGQDNAVIDSQFTGKSVVATGTFRYFSRNGMNRTIEKLGGSAKGSVSKKTDFVVAGENAGSKLTKANELGVTILHEQDILDMLGVPAGKEEEFADRE